MGSENEQKRQLRYLAPNAMTAISLCFGLVSLAAAHTGHFALAGWMIIYAVLTDRLDGLVARMMRATSELGMQLDSFADMLNFGVAPAFMLWSYLTARPDMPYATNGWERWVLALICALYVVCAVFRLARYNITSDEDLPTKIFFGVPTTLAGGTVTIWFLAMHKYDVAGHTFGGPKVLGDFITPRGMWVWFPAALLVAAYLMISSLPMPKGGVSRRKLLTAAVFVPMAAGYVGGFLQVFPEIFMWLPTAWLAIFLVWGQVSSTGRNLKPPRLFPRADDVQPRVRHQEDLGTDEEP